jgi:hypothetical protein
MYLCMYVQGVGFYSPCTSTHSGLLCLTPMTDEDDFWRIGMKTGRGNRSTRRKPTPAPLCPPQNPTWQTRTRTPDRSGGKPATNRLSYGAAFFSPISSALTTRRVTVEVFDPASTRVNNLPKMHLHENPISYPYFSHQFRLYSTDICAWTPNSSVINS